MEIFRPSNSLPHGILRQPPKKNFWKIGHRPVVAWRQKWTAKYLAVHLVNVQMIIYTDVYEPANRTSRRGLFLRLLRTGETRLPPRAGGGGAEQPGGLRHRQKLRNEGPGGDYRDADLGRPAALPGGDLHQTRFRVVRGAFAADSGNRRAVQPGGRVLLHRRDVFRRPVRWISLPPEICNSAFWTPRACRSAWAFRFPKYWPSWHRVPASRSAARWRFNRKISKSCSAIGRSKKSPASPGAARRNCWATVSALARSSCGPTAV